MSRTVDEVAVQAGQMLGAAVESWDVLDSQHIVLRCKLADGRSVIVKRVVIEDDDDWMERRFRNECASLAFLRGVGAEMVPQLLAAEIERQIVITEDMGKVADMKAILQGDDRANAEAGLRAYARSMASMQALTIEERAAFDEERRRYGVDGVESDANIPLERVQPQIEKLFGGLQIAVHEDFYEEAGALSARMAAYPGATFLHRDLGPHNVLYDGQTARLVDFEFGGYGNPLLEMVRPRMQWPSSWQCYRVPDATVEAFETVFRAELVKSMPELADDDTFARMRADACGQWVLAKTWPIWRDYLERRLEQGESLDAEIDARSSWNITDIRRMVSTRMRMFVAIGGDWLPAMTATFASTIEAWDGLFPEDGWLGMFPVFE